jgi:hypothetical protein
VFPYDGGRTDNPLAQAERLLEQAFALIDAGTDPLAALLIAEADPADGPG